MQSGYLTRPGALVLLLIVLLLLSFSMPGNSSEPMTKRVLQVHLEMYDSQDKVNEACDATKPGQGVNGCTWKLGEGRWRVVTLKPRSFCDWARMRTLGHEMMHAAGFLHDEAYRIDEGDGVMPWKAVHCAMTR